MSTVTPPLEQRLATLLRRGTWIASGLIAIGIALALLPSDRLPGTAIMTAGIALFIALPIARVATMAISFSRARDKTFATISAIVLATILIGCVIGLIWSITPE